jgi:hypothetical protein
MLVAALREAATPRAVIELTCSPDLDCKKLFGNGSASPDAPVPVTIGEEPGRSVPPSPIFVFADADRLTDDQIGEFYEAAQAIPTESDALEAGVLLARSAFVSHFEGPELHFFEEGLAAHVPVQQLERGEVEAFIRHQLPPGEGANLLTAQRVALIALTSGGNPAVVNRLARRMLEIEPDVSAGGWRRYIRKSSGNRSIAQTGASAAGDEITLPRVMPRRYAVSLSLPAGIIICLLAAWLVAGTVESQQHLGAFVGFVRDHILPRNGPSEAPAGAGVALSPAAAMGSPSVNVAAAAPSAASAGETTPEPVATSADHSGAAPSLGSTPESAPQPVADGPRISASEIAALMARGDGFLAAGDIASARLFFERAANTGDARAAMRMAVTYDAAFLERAGLRGPGGDPERATFWYRRARDLGEGKAEPPPDSPGTSGSAAPLLQPR